MPLVEFAAVRRLRAGQDSHLTLHARNREFQEKIPAASLAAADAVIAFDTSAWILARSRRSARAGHYLDRTIARIPRRYARIMAGFNRRYPDWAVPVG